MEAWYKVTTPRKEVREGRSFNPDEFAIHLEQVIAKTAPVDYRDPKQFFARTCFTRALREHAGMVLRRLAGETSNTSPVMTLVTQFGGGKTHTLTALYHLVTSGGTVADDPGVANLLKEAGIKDVPQAKVAVFVGNAWDPQDGRETPWIDVARQLGESRLVAAIDADISGAQSHARALDADTKGALESIHRRVATAVLFESSGGQVAKVAHLPELRFALGEPNVDTTSVDSAAFALEDRAYFIRRVGSDGFKIGYQPTMKKVVSDRRASLDEDTEVRPAMRSVVEKEFNRGASIPIVHAPADGAAVQDTPKLTLVVVEPESEWAEAGPLRQEIAAWTKQRGGSSRLYPGSLVWCVRKPGRDLREKVELWLAWRRVAKEVADGTLGGEFDRADRAELPSKASSPRASRPTSDRRSRIWGCRGGWASGNKTTG